MGGVAKVVLRVRYCEGYDAKVVLRGCSCKDLCCEGVVVRAGVARV